MIIIRLFFLVVEIMMRLASQKILGLILIVLMVFPGSLVAEEDNAPSSPAAHTLLEDVPGYGRDLAPKAVIIDREWVALYVNAEGRIVFQGKEQNQILDKETTRPGGKYPTLYIDEKRLYALWWQKQQDGTKHLYFRTSPDGGKTFWPVKIINSDIGVLPTFNVAFDGDGQVAVVYHDERKPRYQIYLNRSGDGGKTWLDKDIRLDTPPLNAEGKEMQSFAVEPQILFHGKTLIVTWKERRSEQKQTQYTRVLSRRSVDGGLNWEPEVEILRGERGFFTSETLLSHGDDVYLIGYLPSQGLLAYRSTDAGRHWESLGSLPGSADVAAISQVKAVSLDDTIEVIYTLELPRKKAQVHLASLAATEGAWRTETQRLDQGETYELTKAISPDLAVLPGGMLVAVWEDYRNIYPNIYMNYSSDGGKTWQENPRPLEKPGKYISERPSLIAQDERLLVLFDRFDSNARQQRDYMYRIIPYDVETGLSELPTFEPPLTAAEKEKRLRERVQQFWQLRIDGKFAETYDLFDPAFRTRFNRLQFAAQQGTMAFHGYEITDIDIWDNIAEVALEVRFSVPETMISGHQIEIKPRDETMGNEWVWIHDQWYMLYEPYPRKYLLNF